jgi:holin-like protein
MLNALTLLVLCQFVGEIFARGVGLPIPGPVVGLVLLLGGLVLRAGVGRGDGPSAALSATANGLLGNLGLLFVPAGVGVVTQLGVLGRNFLPVAVSILVSTFIGLMVTGWVMQRFAGPDEEGR